MALHAVRWDGSPAPRPRPVLQAQHTVSPGLLLEVPLGAGPVCRAKPCRRRSEGDHILLSASPPGVRAKELSSCSPTRSLWVLCCPDLSGGQSDAMFLRGIEGAGAVSCLQHLLQVSAQKD